MKQLYLNNRAIQIRAYLPFWSPRQGKQAERVSWCLSPSLTFSTSIESVFLGNAKRTTTPTLEANHGYVPAATAATDATSNGPSNKGD